LHKLGGVGGSRHAIVRAVMGSCLLIASAFPPYFSA
jgi:hypothetical protein